MRRVDAAQVERLDVIQQRMEQQASAGQVAAFDATTDDFHQALLETAGNPWLEKVTTELRNFLRLARSQSQFSDARLMQTLAEHRTLMRSIDRRDADSAEQVMSHHLLAQQRAWRQWQARQQAVVPAADVDAASSDQGQPPVAVATAPAGAQASPAVQASAATRPSILNIPSDSESVGV